MGWNKRSRSGEAIHRNKHTTVRRRASRNDESTAAAAAEGGAETENKAEAESTSTTTTTTVKQPAATAQQQPKQMKDVLVLYPRPPSSLSVWQQTALSSLSLYNEYQHHAHNMRAQHTLLQRESSKFFTDKRLFAKKLELRQRACSNRLGKAVFNAVKRAWDRAGRVNHHIMKIDFEAQKHASDALRQEDLLRETEALTKRLVEDLTRDASQRRQTMNDMKQQQHHHAATPSTQSPAKCGDDDDSTNSDAPLEEQLHLLNTLNGARPLRDYQRSALRWMLHLYDRGLNGILADEMGLGKTVQTLALLAYFAEYKNDWGPHLIVVPTTVVMNWIAECKRWVPGMKVIAYVGGAKERAQLRKGWCAEDAFHICVTTYNLVVNDRAVFRRRPWGHLVLDEAHYIKNFASAKWMALFDLQTQHRLMLTGTPLQNSVMELWSLFHFLLPFASAFRSDTEFREWFSNPMNDMVEGRTTLNEDVVRRLQALLRPFLLRRLKRDVESQLPTKTEKVIVCPLSRRQRLMYDSFMVEAETREKLSRGGVGGVLGVLLSLRKVCNHPDLFRERPTVSPLVVAIPYGARRGACLVVPRVVCITSAEHRRCRIPVNKMLDSAWTSITAGGSLRKLGGGGGRRSNGGYGISRHRLHIEVDDVRMLEQDEDARGQVVDAAQTHWLEEIVWDRWISNVCCVINNDACLPSLATLTQPPQQMATVSPFQQPSFTKQIGCNESLKPLFEIISKEVASALRQRQLQRTQLTIQHCRYHAIRTSQTSTMARLAAACHSTLISSVVQIPTVLQQHNGVSSSPCWVPSLAGRLSHWTTQQLIARVCVYVPKALCCDGLQLWSRLPLSAEVQRNGRYRLHTEADFAPLFALHEDYRHSASETNHRRRLLRCERVLHVAPFGSEGWSAHVRRSFNFPEKRLLIHDCGKFQVLEPLLKTLRAEGHRALIFSQFTSMLDLLEKFLSCIGVSYLRLDGSTKPEARQQYTELFNQNSGITCMILSTRSGGIGLNLTGADTVFFYDSDWNPTIDLQAQDRCHRIGQTRPVTIYRLVSQHTVEEKILEKARERKLLNNVVIRGGQFHAMAEVADERFASEQEAFAAVSASMTSLKSFFHDLDEDATVVLGDGDEEGQAKSMMDLRAEMAAVEDDADQRALRSVEDELHAWNRATAADAHPDDDDDDNAGDDGVQAAEVTAPFNNDGTMRSHSQRSSLVSTLSSASPITRVIPATTFAKTQLLRSEAQSAQERSMVQYYHVTHRKAALKQYTHLVEHFGADVSALAELLRVDEDDDDVDDD